MAKCPKCGTKLHFFNASQFCPECGVNMRFYGFEENFFREAKLAEISQAGIKTKIARLKASFIGSKLTIARLCVMLLPLLSLIVPNGSINISFPGFEAAGGEYPLGILGIVGLFTDGKNAFGNINSFAGFSFAGPAFANAKTCLFAYLAIAVLALTVLFMCLLCFISYKNMQKITAVTSAIGALYSLAVMILIPVFSKKGSGFVSVKPGFGLLVTVAAFGAVFAVNLLLWKKGIEVTYEEGALERYKIYEDYKHGKVNLDDLPQPVVETEKTRKIDEEIRKEEEAYRARHNKKESEEGNK